MTSTSLRTTIALVRAVLTTTLLAAGLVGLAEGVVETPARLADGSEVVVTDRHGDHLLGYGRVERGELRLSFAEYDDDGLAVMVIDPEGGMSTLVGRFAADGLRVRVPGTERDVTLASWLSGRGVRLTLDLARTNDDDREDGRDDDDRDGAPAHGPSDDGDGGDDHGDDDDAPDADDDAPDAHDDAPDADDPDDADTDDHGDAGDDDTDDPEDDDREDDDRDVAEADEDPDGDDTDGGGREGADGDVGDADDDGEDGNDGDDGDDGDDDDP